MNNQCGGVCLESQRVRLSGYRWRYFGRPRYTRAHCTKNSVSLCAQQAYVQNLHTVVHARGLCWCNVPCFNHKRACIIGIEYLGRCRIKMAVYEIPNYILGVHLVAFLMRYGHLLSVSSEYQTGELGVRIDVGQKSLYSIFNSLEIGRKNYPVIVTGRKPGRWKCGVIGHLTPSCPEKKASGVPPKPDTNPPSIWNYLFHGACKK